MIIVEQPEKSRIKSKELLRKVQDMHDRANQRAGYCQRPCPEKRGLKENVAFEAELNDTAKGILRRDIPVHAGKVRKSLDPNALRELENVV
jgi:hypothetical protein